MKKPIVFFDIESTGVNPESDRIVELSMLKVFPDGKTEIKTRRLNPGIPISPGATEVHGISNEDVKDEPTFPSVAKSVWGFMDGCSLAAYNGINFDIPMLAKEFERASVAHTMYETEIIDPLELFSKILPRTLTSAYKFFCGKDLEGAHGAEADIVATKEIFEVMVEQHGDVIGTTIEEIAKNSRKEGAVDLAGKIVMDDKGVYVYNFGRDKGKSVRMFPSFAYWMFDQSFITEETKMWLRKILG